MPNPMIKLPSHNSNNNNGGQFGRGGFPRSPNEQIVNPAWTPYPLLSKTLTVANIPPEFTPKDLYELFCEFGNAEGAFVYAFPDAKGRRVGEVAMTSYLHAQKVSHLKLSG
jgi:RNA recognition motif-containing protein